jgi:putative Holliday junction resolvase
VVGYPFTHGRTANAVTEQIDKFIDELEKLYPDKPVHKVDESFTSKMAAQTLLQSGVSKKERRVKENIDAISANIILQSYLQLKTNS